MARNALPASGFTQGSGLVDCARIRGVLRRTPLFLLFRTRRPRALAGRTEISATLNVVRLRHRWQSGRIALQLAGVAQHDLRTAFIIHDVPVDLDLFALELPHV